MSYPVIQYPSKEDYSVPQWNTNMLVAFSGLDSLGEGSTFIEEMQQHESATQRSSHSGDDDDGQSAEGTPFDEDEAFNQFMQFGTVVRIYSACVHVIHSLTAIITPESSPNTAHSQVFSSLDSITA